MSLVKSIQSTLAPTTCPWLPPQNGDITRFVNELVLEEESDHLPDGSGYASHFEIYVQAMEEIGADTTDVTGFLDQVRLNGVDIALQDANIPAPSQQFTRSTFDIIQRGQAHEIAAALALGREHIIPVMFRSILKTIGITEKQAPVFHYYLKRHIELDGDQHGPMSLIMLNSLCKDDSLLIHQAQTVATQAVSSRILFWDGVLDAIDHSALRLSA